MTTAKKPLPAAVELGRRGGKARVAKLPKEEIRSWGAAAAKREGLVYRKSNGGRSVGEPSQLDGRVNKVTCLTWIRGGG